MLGLSVIAWIVPKFHQEDKDGAGGLSPPRCLGGACPLAPSPSPTLSHTRLQPPAGILHQHTRRSPFQLTAHPQRVQVRMLNLPPAPWHSRSCGITPFSPRDPTGCWGQATFVTAQQGILQVL